MKSVCYSGHFPCWHTGLYSLSNRYTTRVSTVCVCCCLSCFLAVPSAGVWTRYQRSATPKFTHCRSALSNLTQPRTHLVCGNVGAYVHHWFGGAEEPYWQFPRRDDVNTAVRVCVRSAATPLVFECVSSSAGSPRCHIHLCLFAKFDFKYLWHHTSWLEQIAGKVLLSVKQAARRMEALEGTSMFHLVKCMTWYLQPQHFFPTHSKGWYLNFCKALGIYLKRSFLLQCLTIEWFDWFPWDRGKNYSHFHFSWVKTKHTVCLAAHRRHN